MPLSDQEIDDLAAGFKVWLKGQQRPVTVSVLGQAPVAAEGPARGLHLTFDEPFDTLDFSRWSTVYRWNQLDGQDAPNIRGSSLPTEKAWYINRAHGPTSRIRPWRVEGGELILTAERMPPDLRAVLGYDQPDLRNLGFYEFTSGLLHTGSSFSQTYGYFEAEMKWSAGKGLWPAFWLLPAKGKPPEIDIVEVLGDRPDHLFHTVHSLGGSAHVESFIGDSGYHRIGVLWTKETIAWFVDGKEVGRKPTPPDAHLPMYLILNLAVGGSDSWPGASDYFTKFPAEMRVRSVRAWA